VLACWGGRGHLKGFSTTAWSELSVNRWLILSHLLPFYFLRYERKTGTVAYLGISPPPRVSDSVKLWGGLPQKSAKLKYLPFNHNQIITYISCRIFRPLTIKRSIKRWLIHFMFNTCFDRQVRSLASPPKIRSGDIIFEVGMQAPPGGSPISSNPTTTKEYSKFIPLGWTFSEHCVSLHKGKLLEITHSVAGLISFFSFLWCVPPENSSTVCYLLRPLNGIPRKNFRSQR